MRETNYDVVLYGASGFVGKQTVRYFAERAGEKVRWAIAGRDRSKLESVKAEVGIDVDILVADSQDKTAIDAIVSQTRVLLNTAGPFALYGNAIVDACVRYRTHYVDITGETPWVKGLIDRYHVQAATDGTRIIPCCGFDSVPSDLGAYLLVRYLQRELGTDCTQVKAYYQAAGGFNGGTLASGLNILDSGELEQLGNPFLLNPPESVPTDINKHRDPTSPQYDAEMETWVAPFFMGVVNTRIVRRSWALFDREASLEENRWQESYGKDFSYQEYCKFNPPLAWLQSAAMVGGMAIIGGAIAIPPLRHLIESILPKVGSGPTEQTMNEGWFRCELLGWGSQGQRVRGLIADVGDPGNRATVKFVCESALCLAVDFDRLPGGAQRGGILTPATGLGDVLVQRLQQAGMRLEVETII
ncbi:saccharopine dehydrogenase family protein [Chamaesiphon polymorphus]|uniref:Saccharopine dehydrogenase n=1 Tax=Chamaesiphon polymorphus CCALA 037 TaxID=2107692 RepID=A0A2T1GE35_9CYAN|nr:saccharopine dehydrogenase NADP-binding domain-containing protein [Chamaesiphon polymorphus]PSB55776.1 saccharopine dehydrogenase [Chamaesiphon polymorphus CCALA 037]